MKKELQQKLYDKYPKLFIEKDLPMIQTCMCWGIDTGNGWYDLLDMLCRDLQHSTDANRHPQVTVTQVKEKFGTLRFYTKDEDDMQMGMIWFAETMSGRICESCGCPATTSNEGGWVNTLCAKCKTEKEEFNA